MDSYSYSESHPIRKGGMKLAPNLADVINNIVLVLECIQISNNTMATVVTHYTIALDSSSGIRYESVMFTDNLIAPRLRF